MWVVEVMDDQGRTVYRSEPDADRDALRQRGETLVWTFEEEGAVRYEVVEAAPLAPGKAVG